MKIVYYQSLDFELALELWNQSTVCTIKFERKVKKSPFDHVSIQLLGLVGDWIVNKYPINFEKYSCLWL